MEITFRALYPWALLPRKIKIDPQPKQSEVRVVEENFRWLRISRSPELCWPWRLGQELGWVIESPVSVTMDVLHDVEVHGPPEALRNLGMITNSSENWSFSDPDGSPERIQCTRMAGWLALYDFRNGDEYNRMFFANGQGSVEWIMGWEVRVALGYFVLLMPHEPIPNLEIIVGVLDAKSLKRPGRNGLAIAVRPTGPVTLTRGQPVARLVLLHADSIRERATFDAFDTPAPGPAGSP